MYYYWSYFTSQKAADFVSGVDMIMADDLTK